MLKFNRAFVICFAIGLTIFGSSLFVSASTIKTHIIADVVPWDWERGVESVKHGANVINEVSPVWYSLDKTGHVTDRLAEDTPTVDKEFISYAHTHGLKIVPLVGLRVDGESTLPTLQGVLHNDALQKDHVLELAGIVSRMEYDGLDIDYEGLGLEDRQVFSQFIASLAEELHKAGKIIGVSVLPRTANDDEGSLYADWTRLGGLVDEFRIMSYDFSWSGGSPGPIAPVWWVDDVLKYAVAHVDRRKIIQGFALYGYEWTEGETTEAPEWDRSMKKAKASHAIIQFDKKSQTPWFKIGKGAKTKTIWFENAQSVAAKLQLMKKYRIAGARFWRLGGEDPAVWKQVDKTLHESH